jgi:hypothetical protein
MKCMLLIYIDEQVLSETKPTTHTSTLDNVNRKEMTR